MIREHKSRSAMFLSVEPAANASFLPVPSWGYVSCYLLYVGRGCGVARQGSTRSSAAQKSFFVIGPRLILQFSPFPVYILFFKCSLFLTYQFYYPFPTYHLLILFIREKKKKKKSYRNRIYNECLFRYWKR